MTNLYLSLGTLVLGAAIAALLIAEPLLPRSVRQPFAVKASHDNGRVRIGWEASHPSVRLADGALLEANDGGVTQQYQVPENVLRRGGLEYRNRTENLLLSLKLRKGKNNLEQVSIRILAPLE